MSTKASVGRSKHRGSFQAGSEAASQAVAALDGLEAHVAIVFATTGYDQKELLRGVREVLGTVKISGCSAEGVITQGNSSEREHAVAVMAIHSTCLNFHTYYAPGYAADSSGAGRSLADMVRRDATDQAKLLMVLPDGLAGNCSEFLGALERTLEIPVAICGGAASDAMRFEKTFQYRDDQVESGGVAALLITGDATVEVAVSHGCAPIGLTRTVTKSDNGWVREIDGKACWSVFKEYLVGDPEDLNAQGIVHLCIGEPLDSEHVSDYDPYIIRTPMSLDKSDGSLFFPGGGLQEGKTIRLTRRDPEKIRESARACAKQILDTHKGRLPSLVIQFDCAGRGRILFGACAAEQIVHPLQETLGNTTPWIGFHTYGEIAPIGNIAHYHNYTVALCAIYDNGDPVTSSTSEVGDGGSR